MAIPTSFDELVDQATRGDRLHGDPPYGYQRRLAEHGLPELLRVPTGCGKTLAATLPWLWRRRFHPDPTVRSASPRWLAFVLPMRVLVEQTERVVHEWIDALGLAADVDVHRVMGGEGRVEASWRIAPDRDAVFIGTLDMLLSRALNRGYGEGRFRWPFDFGLFNAGVQWVFDEVQLMGPALPTSRQLEGLRQALGTAMPSRSMWMSATVDLGSLSTVDLPGVSSVVEIADDDRLGLLSARLDAPKTVRRLDLNTDRYEQALASTLVQHHQAGTRTIAIVNTVDRARLVYDEVGRRSDAEVVLLHSRFRPGDRRSQVDAALVPVEASGPGRIVVSTQVIEAGVDVSSATLFTEAAPWPSIVQRAGRCNRAGEDHGAVLLWAEPPKPEPYEADDVSAASVMLGQLEGQEVSPTILGGLDVAVTEVVHPVLRRRDLLDLFDTAPDLSGNDIDVGRFLRADGDLDVAVAWRDVTKDGPTDEDDAPAREERCPVPIRDLRKEVARRSAWRVDHLGRGARRWVPCQPADVRPGQVVVLRASEGGYRSDVGWDPHSKQIVAVLIDGVSEAATSTLPGGSGAGLGAGETETANDDVLTLNGAWVSLVDHLEHVGAEVEVLAGALRPSGISAAHVEAAIAAGRLHDIGKAHHVFQTTLRKSASDPAQAPRADSCPQPWAKSDGARYRHERPHFSHELAGALALMGAGRTVIDGLAEPDLVVYLVGAHHGRVRLGVRSSPDEKACEDGGRATLGICEGDVLPLVAVPGGHVPESRLDLSVAGVGDGMQPSWTQRALDLLDQLGPFRLAFLEALVVSADWRASADEKRMGR